MRREPRIPSVLARVARLGCGLAALVLLAACGGRALPSGPGLGSGESATVIVQRGDTVSAIARRHGVPLQPVIAANGLRPPYVIRPGQVLHVPGTLPPPRPVVASLPPPVPVGGVASPSALGTPGLDAQVAASEPAAARAVTEEALPPPSPAVAGAEPAPQVASLPMPPPPPPATIAEAAAASGGEPTRAERPGPRSVVAPPRRLPPGRFAWPVRGQVVSAFGAKGGGMVNDGLNIAAPRGTPIRAAADGTVMYAGNEVRGYGNLVLIQHQGGWVTAYGHAERLLVRQGETVRAGEEIAQVGSTGAVTTPQLHFQIRQAGKPVDPAARLDRAVAERS